MPKLSGGQLKYKPEVFEEVSQRYYQECLNNSRQLPSIAGLAVELDISRETLYQWVKTYHLSDIITKLQALQERRVLELGITNSYNPVFSMFLLKAKHGYVDHTIEVKQGDSVGLFQVVRGEIEGGDRPSETNKTKQISKPAKKRSKSKHKPRL